MKSTMQIAVLLLLCISSGCWTSDNTDPWPDKGSLLILFFLTQPIKDPDCTNPSATLLTSGVTVNGTVSTATTKFRLIPTTANTRFTLTNQQVAGSLTRTYSACNNGVLTDLTGPSTPSGVSCNDGTTYSFYPLTGGVGANEICDFTRNDEFYLIGIRTTTGTNDFSFLGQNI